MFEPAAAGRRARGGRLARSSGSLQFSPACLRVYGHPELLAVAAAINGDDFVPFNEALLDQGAGPRRVGRVAPGRLDALGQPGLGLGTHGFNFMGQLYGCTSANGVWVVPGSHKHGKVDIKAMVAEAGSDRLPDAVPIVCEARRRGDHQPPGVHGSFANTSPDPRVTINFGFHRRRSVLGVESGGVHNAGGRVRRGAHRTSAQGDRVRHRRAPAALSRRAAVRVPAACRAED